MVFTLYYYIVFEYYQIIIKLLSDFYYFVVRSFGDDKNYSGAKNEYMRQEFKSHRQPAIGDNAAVIVCLRICVDELKVALLKAGFVLVGPYCRCAVHALAEMRVNGRLGDGLDALQLARRVYEYSLYLKAI